MFRVALRRSIGVWVAPLFLAIEVLNATQYVEVYTRSWLGAADTAGGALILVAPLAAGVAAGETVMWGRSGSSELLDAAGGMSTRVHLSRILALSVWVALAHTVGILVTYGWTVSSKGSLGWIHPEVHAAGYALIFAYVAIGAAAGRYLPTMVIAPALALVLYLIPAFDLALSSAHFSVGGSTSVLVGLRYESGFLIAQVVWFAVLTGSACSVFSSRWRGWTGGVGVGLCVIAALLLASVAGERLRPASTLEWECLPTSSGVPVCAPQELAEELVRTRAALAGPLDRAAELGWNDEPPERVVTWGVGATAQDLVIPIGPTEEFFRQDVAHLVVRWIANCSDQDYVDPDLDLGSLSSYFFGPPVEEAERDRLRARIAQLADDCAR